MSTKKSINVVVVGVSGIENTKGSSGVGKSLLCNRFVRPAADDFHREHTSVLSQTDFSGSSVINSDHWLYWGERKFGNSGNISVRVVEQTEFIDDETYEIIAPSCKNHTYSQRCSCTKLRSRDKLMYIQKEQLGLESDYAQYTLPDGKFDVDGFIILCDVSREYSRHSEAIMNIALSVAKAKKPVIIVYSKCDQMLEDSRKSYTYMFMSTKELKHFNMPPIETSSVKNVNVENAFYALVSSCLRINKHLTKSLPYEEACYIVEQRNLHVKCSFQNLLSQIITKFTGAEEHCSWSILLAEIDRHPHLQNFLLVYGSQFAFEMYEKYILEAKNVFFLERLQSLLPQLVFVFKRLDEVVNIVERDWLTAKKQVLTHPLLDEFFELSEFDASSSDRDNTNFMTRVSTKLPFEVLMISEAEMAYDEFKIFAQNLRVQRKLAKELDTFFSGKTEIYLETSFDEARCVLEKFSFTKSISLEELKEVYELHQKELIVECVLRYLPFIWSTEVHRMDLTETDRLPAIMQYIEADRRFERTSEIQDVKKRQIASILPFIFSPSCSNCTAGSKCIEILIRHNFNTAKSEKSQLTSTPANTLTKNRQRKATGHVEDYPFEKTLRTRSGTKPFRIQFLMMCGDEFNVEFLSSTALKQLNGSRKRKFSRIDVRSYHKFLTSKKANPDRFAGYVLFYDARREASFLHARTTIEKLAEMSTLFLRITVLLVAIIDHCPTDLSTEGFELSEAIGSRFSVIDSETFHCLNETLMEFYHDVSEADLTRCERPSSFTGPQMTKNDDHLNMALRSNQDGVGTTKKRVNRTDPVILSSFCVSTSQIREAPLATPETVDFSPVYSIVNDAIKPVESMNNVILVDEHDYGCSSESFNNINEFPTRDKNTEFTKSLSPDNMTNLKPHYAPVSTGINRLHRTFNVLHMIPSTTLKTERKSLSIDSLTENIEVKQRNQGSRFVRKVATSFRLRSGILKVDLEGKTEEEAKSGDVIMPNQISTLAEKMATRSLPQSPRITRKTKLYTSFNNTTEKVSNVLSWLPSKTSKRCFRIRSATDDLSASISNSATTKFKGVVVSGQSIESLSQRSTSGIPVFIEKCIHFIEHNDGLDQEGLYRVPGNQNHLAELEKTFLQTGEFNAYLFDTPVHVAATALKHFFSCLPEPLIPSEYHTSFKQLISVVDEKETHTAILKCLKFLPEVNQHVFRYLVVHLAKVSCSTKTGMDSKNLSKVWSPTLFRPRFTSYQELSSGMISFQLALQSMITNSDLLFASQNF